jgi:hypothetical protein
MILFELFLIIFQNTQYPAKNIRQEKLQLTYSL